jgi:predicted secreted protein
LFLTGAICHDNVAAARNLPALVEQNQTGFVEKPRLRECPIYNFHWFATQLHLLPMAHRNQQVRARTVTFGQTSTSPYTFKFPSQQSKVDTIDTIDDEIACKVFIGAYVSLRPLEGSIRTYLEQSTKVLFLNFPDKKGS